MSILPISAETLIVTPAYGRDYKSAEVAKADWENNLDFVIQNTAGNLARWTGKYCNKADAAKFVNPDGVTEIRFNRLTDLVIVENT